MRKKLLFIYNQHAGKAKIKNHLVAILDIFTKAGYEVTARPTQFAGDARETVCRKIEEYDLIVCSGGDGTFDEVVSGIVDSGIQVPLGYIPAGSTNDFATSLKLSKSMPAAAKTAVSGKRFLCDLGHFNDDIFVYIAAFGLFTDVSYETSQEVKNVLGHLAYILEGMKKLSSIRSYKLRIEADGKVINDEFIYGMITNSTSVGGFKMIAGNSVRLNDGRFELTLVKAPKNPLDLQKIISSLLTAESETDSICCIKAANVSIESEEEIAWTIDGEFGGNHKKVEIWNEKKGLCINVP